MKELENNKSVIIKKEATYIVDENLNKLKSKNLAPKKLEEANTLLKKINSPLPK